MTNTKKTKKKSINKYKSKHSSRYKTKKHNSFITKNKTLRIIFVHSPSLENDATIYKTEFLKQGYKVEFKLIDSVNHFNKGKS